jgi:hypothetical protein
MSFCNWIIGVNHQHGLLLFSGFSSVISRRPGKLERFQRKKKLDPKCASLHPKREVRPSRDFSGGEPSLQQEAPSAGCVK